MTPVKYNRRERGSALLVVLVFAAMIAIALYAEMPVVLFEAKRQKEQLLVDRGHQYVRAIQLFYRRNHGQYPSSIEQLENTNNVRFLRRRYKDPFTGKDDWRLLHAGPGGMLIDSKVSPLQQPGQNGPLQQGQTSQTASSPHPPQSDSDSAEVVVPDVPQRAPAVSASGGGTPVAADQQQNPDAPILPPATSDTGTLTVQDALAQQQQSATGTATTATGSSPATARAGIGIGTGSTRSTFGSTQLMGGALAGVASKAKGHSIKLINDQDDYSLWEFYYDPSKDATLGGGGQIQQMLQQNPNQGTQSPTQSTQFGTQTTTPASPTAGQSVPAPTPPPTIDTSSQP